jgi:hypothetical protein
VNVLHDGSLPFRISIGLICFGLRLFYRRIEDSASSIYFAWRFFVERQMSIDCEIVSRPLGLTISAKEINACHHIS